ncbi:hypothetical protein [Nonomuraea zeae]|uniref:Uncharacterized protein n=1 Tax=Nonomuraea zeae TaxID=1642303 RepID=A0A5S4H2W3_9ACTN|nr:hypothetical protein [Nonomuraea zeae]TMR39593.1 hypothetical protein ETD85_00850 [Nonomuraea zeae]
MLEDDGAWSWASTLVGGALLLVIAAFLRFPRPYSFWSALLKGIAVGSVITMCVAMITAYPTQQLLLGLSLFPNKVDMPGGSYADRVADVAIGQVVPWAIITGVAVTTGYVGAWSCGRRERASTSRLSQPLSTRPSSSYSRGRKCSRLHRTSWGYTLALILLAFLLGRRWNVTR